MQRLPHVLLAALLAACSGEPVSGVVEAIPEPGDRPFEPLGDDHDPLEPDFEFELALEQGGMAARVTPLQFEDARAELALEDLYLEMWHGGDREATALMDAVRECDEGAAIRFGPTRRVRRVQLDPPASWPLELRYRASDPRGLEAAELLREHLREVCDEDAREALMRIVGRRGLMLRPVPELEVEDAGRRTVLVLVHGIVRT